MRLFIQVTNLLGKKVIDVACGGLHSLALTSEGDVFAWGHNGYGQVGSGSTTHQLIPRKVTACIGGRRVIVIACGLSWSMAVLDDGEVYGWGHNDRGQLGLGNKVDQIEPCLVVNLKNVVIKQIVCGYGYTMALSDQGVLYGWGYNCYGQLGTGSYDNFVVPQIIAPEIGRVVEIAATLYNQLSAAMTQTSKVYMWGHCCGQLVRTPTATRFHSVHEVFARCAKLSMTCRSMKLDVVPVKRVSDSLRIAFDDPQSSDVKFLVEGKFIHVHKSVLKIGCEHFRSMFQDHRKDVVEIDEYSYPVYRAFLQYLYTDTVELPPEEAIGLLDLAISYREHRLKRHCERIIEHGIIVDNVAAVTHASRMDLEKWSIFSLLSAEFVGKIRLACVFGRFGREALVVTVDDDVYGLSSTTCRYLVHLHVRGILEPRKLEGLCKKKFKSILCGEEHLLAVTETGDVYGCGSNSYGQMGNGTTDQVSLPI